MGSEYVTIGENVLLLRAQAPARRKDEYISGCHFQHDEQSCFRLGNGQTRLCGHLGIDTMDLRIA